MQYIESLENCLSFGNLLNKIIKIECELNCHRKTLIKMLEVFPCQLFKFFQHYSQYSGLKSTNNSDIIQQQENLIFSNSSPNEKNVATGGGQIALIILLNYLNENSINFNTNIQEIEELFDSINYVRFDKFRKIFEPSDEFFTFDYYSNDYFIKDFKGLDLAAEIIKLNIIGNREINKLREDVVIKR